MADQAGRHAFFSLGLNPIEPASLRYPESIHLWRDEYGGSMLRWLHKSVAPSLLAASLLLGTYSSHAVTPAGMLDIRDFGAVGLTLSNVQIKPAASDLRPAIVCDDVQDLDLNGVNLSGNADAESLVRLQNVNRATVRNSSVLSPCNVFTLVEGEESEEIVVSGDNQVKAQQLREDQKRRS